jgi:hypothetical protein
MKDYLELSPTPTDEPCAMLGTEGYSQRARLECRVFIHQLERTFPQAIAAGVTFRTASNPHDFGTYYEVRAHYNDEDESQTEWVFVIEGTLPEQWDNDARAELAAHGYDTIPA